MGNAATVGARFAATFERRAHAPAVQFEGTWLCYRELDERSASVARGLRRLGVGRGDRVAVALGNSPDLIAAVVGTLRRGAVLVPINPAASAEEVAYIAGDSGARVALVAAAHRQALADLPSLQRVVTELPDGSGAGDEGCDEADPALIVYTSGTTGKPKGAVLSHRALVQNFDGVARAWEWTEADRLLLVLPCFHLHGLGLGILTSLMVGSSILLRPRLQLGELLGDLDANRATMFFGVPTIYNRLVAVTEAELARADLSRMRLWVSGSAPLSPVTFERFRQRFGCALMDRYGMTECGFALSTELGAPRRPGVVGRPLPGAIVKLADAERLDRGEIVAVADGETGEILIGGAGLFDGYWGREAATRAAMIGGLLRSGDIGVRDPDGQFRIVGRSSVDIIKTRGFKVGAGEVEEVLQRYPGVEEAAVVGVPDADQGECIVAVVTMQAGAEFDAQALLSFARGRLAPHKLPVRIECIAEIPKTGPGKFKKKELIARLGRP